MCVTILYIYIYICSKGIDVITSGKPTHCDM